MAANNKSRFITVDAEQITFGVEIECFLPDSYLWENHIRIGRYHHGYALPAPFPPLWETQADSSLRNCPAGYTPLEIVSPVLHGSQGISEIVQVFDMLNAAEAKINSTCGFHVHVGIASLLGESPETSPVMVRFLHRILNLVSHHEFGIYATINSPERMRNDYCKTVKTRDENLLIATTDDLDLVKERKIEDRYHTLNLCNLFNSKQTIEFRIFAATLNSIKAIGYITTALGLCHRAAQVPQSPKFDFQLCCPEWQDAGDQLLQALGQTQRKPGSARIPYGWPKATWLAYGEKVTELQQRCISVFANRPH